MNETELLPMSEFIELSRTDRDRLNHYEKVGILFPAHRNERSKRRYYSIKQLAQVNLIRTLQDMGMSLKEIKKIADHRTPESTYTLLMNQIETIDEKINKWTDARKLLYTIQKSIYSGLLADKNDIIIQQLPAEKIIVGDDCGHCKNPYDMLRDFYNAVKERYLKLNLNYPVWAIFSKAQIEQKDWHMPSRYYFYNPEGKEERPAGLYAVGHAYGKYGQTDELYKKIIDYINKSDYEICGNAYEEYPLNEICVSDENNYLIRIIIAVQKQNR